MDQSTTPGKHALAAHLNDAIGRAMASYGASRGTSPLPRLSWTLSRRGVVAGYASDDHVEGDKAAVLARWAELLGLAADPDAPVGTAEFSGAVSDVEIQVWGITDRAAWDAWVRGGWRS